MTLTPAEYPPIVYSIDAGDRLCAVNEAWGEFAEGNGGEALKPALVLSRSLWDFVRDAHVSGLYWQLIQRARTGYEVQFEYRCDAPSWRRLFLMTMQGDADGGVEFTSQLLWEDPRPQVELLEAGAQRNANWVKVCSWCQDVELPDGQWVPVEQAVARSGLLKAEKLPRLTHGLCPQCKAEMLEKLPDPKA